MRRREDEKVEREMKEELNSILAVFQSKELKKLYPEIDIYKTEK